MKCSRLQKVKGVTILLQSRACCLEFSPDRSNLLFGCVNGSVVLYNQTRALSHIVRTAFVPAIIKWHSDGYLSAVGSAKGQIQCFDSALNAIKIQSLSEDVCPSSVIDLSDYFTQSTNPQTPFLVEMEWNSKHITIDPPNGQCEDGFLLLSFAGGPLVMLRVFNANIISPNFLVSES